MSRVAVVTGGIGGLGTAMCKALIEQGRRAVAVDYNGLSQEAVDKWKADRKAEGLDIPVYLADVTDFDSCAETCKKIEAEVGPIEILVNNAGITRDAMFHKMTPEQWIAVINTNLNSMFNMTKQVYGKMVERGWGPHRQHLVGERHQRAKPAKPTIRRPRRRSTASPSRWLRNAPRKGVTVNSISPGYIGTEMVRAIREDVLASIVKTIPVGRLGEPSEIGRTVAFMTAEDGGFLTGEDVTVNGGLYFR